MSKKLLFTGTFCLILLSMASQPGPGAGQVRVGDKPDAQIQKCAEECGACQRACDSCAAHCARLLLGQSKKEHYLTLQTCQDCATHCSAAASIVAREGPFSDTICKACAEACGRCAKECEKHASHDAVMKQCGEACRKCEQACRDMLSRLSAAKTAERRE
jgi:hypothetical protein